MVALVHMEVDQEGSGEMSHLEQVKPCMKT